MPESKIGLFGGSFDPPHIGHFIIASRAVEAVGLDQVIFIPCRKSPHKSDSKPCSGEERLAMVRSGIRDLPWAKLSSIELKREGLSYSYDTILYFKKMHPKARIFWIMGADQWDVFDQWWNNIEIEQLVEFVIYPRPGRPKRRMSKRAHFIDFRIDVSSSEIRERIAKQKSIKHFVPESIRHLIERKGLYQ